MAVSVGEQLISTGNNWVKPTDKLIPIDSKYENDFLFESLSDLVNNQFRAWYCKQFYRLGKVKVLELAQTARSDGKNPKKLFSKLIKNA